MAGSGRTALSLDRGRQILLLPLLACLYLPFIGGGFLTDDFRHVLRLQQLDGVHEIVGRPDKFSFYRPLAQASIALDLSVHGPRPARLRAFNVLLHAANIALAFQVARLVLASTSAALLAALAFALTPKAHPIAVLWISARAELLMSLFSFLAVAAWIRWTRGGAARWLIGAIAAYTCAFLSKETAALLPLLLLVTPRPDRTHTTRFAGVGLMGIVATAIYVWRAHIGALTPFSVDAHYALGTGMARWLRSLQSYVPRLLPAPIGLLAVLIAGRLIAVDKARTDPAEGPAPMGGVLRFSLAWTAVFLAPAIPLVARSELYLYLPAFGMCLIAGAVGDVILRQLPSRHQVIVIALFVVAFGGYQMSRAFLMHQDLLFSERLVTALQSNTQLASTEGVVELAAGDAASERALRNAIGGYVDEVLDVAFGDQRHEGYAAYDPAASEARPAAGLLLICRYVDEEVTLTSVVRTSR